MSIPNHIRPYVIIVYINHFRNRLSFNENRRKTKKMTERTHFAATKRTSIDYSEFYEPGNIPLAIHATAENRLSAGDSRKPALQMGAPFFEKTNPFV